MYKLRLTHILSIILVGLLIQNIYDLVINYDTTNLVFRISFIVIAVIVLAQEAKSFFSKTNTPSTD